MRTASRFSCCALLAGLTVVGDAVGASTNSGTRFFDGNPGGVKKVSDVAADLHRISGSDQQRINLELLRNSTPVDGADVEALRNLSRQPEARGTALRCLAAVRDPMVPSIRQAYVALLDDADVDVLKAALDVCVSHDLTEAIVPLRKKLAKVYRHRIRTETEARALGYRAAAGDPTAIAAFRTSAWGHALASLGDRQSVDLLFGLDEVLCSGPAGTSLAVLGLPALEVAIRIAHAEKGLRRKGALSVIAASTALENEGALKALVNDPDPEVRSQAIIALGSGGFPGAVAALQTVGEGKNAKDAKFAWWMLARSHPEQHAKEIVSSIWGRGPLDQYQALSLASSGRYPGIEGELERFIKEDEKKHPNSSLLRREAARGIWKRTGRKILYKRGRHENRVYPYPWDDERMARQRGDW